MPTTEIIRTEVPGTVYLVDINHESNAIHNRQGDVLLVPQPSESPKDPLNWRWEKKFWTLFLCSLYACIMAFGENILGAAWTTVSEEAHVSLINMNGGSGLNWLLLGFANLFWIPIGMKIGRKFVYMASLLIMVCMYSWSSVFMGTGQFFGTCALGGLGTSAYQALIQLTIMDIFFAHERGTMLAVYVWSQGLGGILGSILGGYIAAGPGWRWGQKICAMLCAFCCVLIFFTMDDSMYPRDSMARSDAAANCRTSASASDNDILGTEDLSPSGVKTKQMDAVDNPVIPGEGTVTEASRSYLETLSLVHYFKEDRTTFYQYFRRPFILFLFPNVVLSGLIFGFAASGGFASFSTIAEILMDDPYNWGTGPTGLINLAGLVGSFVGMATGTFSDRLVLSLARKNRGYKEPEMRLWAIWLSGVYTVIGYMCYGWVAQKGGNWFGIALGLAFMSAQQVSAASLATAYAMECFEGEEILPKTTLKNQTCFEGGTLASEPTIIIALPGFIFRREMIYSSGLMLISSVYQVGGEIVVVLAICSSVINFAVSYTVQPLIDVMGYGWTMTFYGALALLSLLGALPMYFCGKEWRRRAGPAYYVFLEETGRL